MGLTRLDVEEQERITVVRLFTDCVTGLVGFNIFTFGFIIDIQFLDYIIVIKL